MRKTKEHISDMQQNIIELHKLVKWLLRKELEQLKFPFPPSKSSDKEKNIFHSLNLSQLITEPMRVTAQTQSLLDWILVSHPNRFLRAGVMSDCFSDHSIIVCVWKIKLPKSPYRLIRIRQYKKLNLN